MMVYKHLLNIFHYIFHSCYKIIFENAYYSCRNVLRNDKHLSHYQVEGSYGPFRDCTRILRIVFSIRNQIFIMPYLQNNVHLKIGLV